ncbi:MAG: XrtA/PEP-CTERM system TPR-repeat protein PrsT [Pseudomonadota bacterium]
MSTSYFFRRLASFALAAFAALITACGGLSADEKLAEAQRAFEANDLRTASVTVRSLLQDEPDNAEARLLFGRVALKSGDIDTAASELNRARDLGISDPLLIESLAEVFLRQTRATDAQALLAGIPGAARSARVPLLEIDAFLQLQDYDAAAAAITALSSERPGDAEVLVRRAWLQIGREELESAYDTAMQARAADSMLVDAPRAAGEAAQRLYRFEAAGEAFAEAGRLATESSRVSEAGSAWFAAAVSYLRARDFERASEAIDGYAGIVGDRPATKYLRASVNFEQRDFVAAQTLLQEAVFEAPDDANILRLLGATKLALSELPEARRNLRAALAQSPSDVAASRLLAQVYLQLGQPDAALEELRDLDATSAANIVLLAQTLMSADRIDEAIALLEQSQSDGLSTSQTRLALAQAYARNGDSEALEATLRASVAGDEEDYASVLQLLRVYVSSGRPEQARELADSILSERPDDYRAHATAILFLQATGEAELALNRARESASTFSDLPQAQLLLASVASATQEFSIAEPAYEAAIALEPDNINALLGLAGVYEQTQRRGSVNAILERAAAATDSDPRPTLALGKFALVSRDFETARVWFERASTIAPAQAEPRALLAISLMGMQQPAGARQALEKSIAQSDALPRHYVALAQLQARGGSLGVASRTLEAASERFPGSDALKIERARLATSRGDLALARTLADGVLEDDPDNILALLLDGDIALLESDLGRARRRFTAMLDGGGGDGGFVGLGRVAIAAGENPEPVLERGLEQFPDSLAIRQTLAQHYQVSGQAAAAEKQYRKIIGDQPDNAIALNNLAWLLHEQGDTEALGLAERAITIAPTAPAVLDTYGVILLSTGRNEEAREALERATEAAASNAEIRYHLAQAQVATGDREAAKASLRQVLQITQSGPVAEGADALLQTLQ